MTREQQVAALNEVLQSEGYRLMRQALRQRIADSEKVMATLSDADDATLARKHRQAQTQWLLYRKMLEHPDDFWLPRPE